MKIAAHQGPVVFGDMAPNLEATLASLEKADDEGVQILCMPETFLHGYFRTEEAAKENSVDLESDEFNKLLERFKPYSPTLLLGLNECRGDRLFNTVAVIENGELIGTYSKNYLVFNYFCRGHHFPVFERDGVKFGIIICADSSFFEPARIAAMRGAQIIFSPHFNYIHHDGVHDHTRSVRNMHIARAVENEVWVVKANVIVTETNGEPNMGYPGVGVGDSFILNRMGIPVAEAGHFTERLLIYDIPDDDFANDQRRFHSASDEIVRQLHEEYRSDRFQQYKRNVSQYDT